MPFTLFQSIFKPRTRSAPPLPPPPPPPAPPALPDPPENILIQLTKYDVVILMDDSLSMIGERWKQAGKALRGVVVEAVKYDKDGIDIEFLNSTISKTVKTEGEVEELFKQVQPRSSTPLGRRLGDLCREYLSSLQQSESELKRRLIIVITDGVPNIKADVYGTIKDTARQLDKLGASMTQLGIQFVQIGNDDEATKFLKELDDDLKGDGEGKLERDMIDTVPYEGKTLTPERLVKILAGAINPKIDNQKNVRL